MRARIVQAGCLTASRRDRMFALYARHFRGARRERFDADLAEKESVIVLEAEDGGLAGFSTLMTLRLSIDGLDRTFLFSGDTIVDPAHWQSIALAGAFSHVMLRLLERSGSEVYWLLITKGYRTYRFLPVYFRRFYPALPASADPRLASLRDAVAQAKFGRAYDAAVGVIRHPPGADGLSAPLCRVPEHRRRDAHVAFFLDQNPGWMRGDELVCLAGISRENFRPAVLRAVSRIQPEWVST